MDEELSMERKKVTRKEGRKERKQVDREELRGFRVSEWKRKARKVTRCRRAGAADLASRHVDEWLEDLMSGYYKG